MGRCRQKLKCVLGEGVGVCNGKKAITVAEKWEDIHFYNITHQEDWTGLSVFDDDVSSDIFIYNSLYQKQCKIIYFIHLNSDTYVPGIRYLILFLKITQDKDVKSLAVCK